MARLLVYDAYENKVYTYSSLNENDPMPYSTGTTLTVREFRGRSNSPVLWTTIAAMEAWNLTRRKYGKGIPVGYAFRRIWEGGHGTRSQHYAGVSFDVGQSLTQTARTAIYNAARGTGAWGYVADNNRFGAADAAAVRAVQQQAGLQPVNGIVYRETWHALQAQCTDPCGCEKEE